MITEQRKQEIKERIEMLAKKRDHCADVLSKPVLAWSYQDEINKLATELETHSE